MADITYTFLAARARRPMDGRGISFTLCIAWGRVKIGYAGNRGGAALKDAEDSRTLRPNRLACNARG